MHMARMDCLSGKQQKLSRAKGAAIYQEKPRGNQEELRANTIQARTECAQGRRISNLETNNYLIGPRRTVWHSDLSKSCPSWTMNGALFASPGRISLVPQGWRKSNLRSQRAF